jgi:ribonuclease D
MPNRIPADWPPVRIVTTADELAVAINEWQAAGSFGIDTESNSFYAYTDSLCLLQVTADGQDWIVDPIALGDDLRAINPLLEDPDFITILHAAEFDLMLLKKDLGAELRGLFDTQVAMTLLQHEKTGLAALIESYYGMKLSKKEQRSNWGNRPLTESQLAYARIDTHFLPDLHQRLLGELDEKGMTAAAEGEFRRQEHEILPPREPNFDAWKKIKGARQLNPGAAARLREIFRWREELAIKLDRPVFRVMPNEAVIALAKSPPQNVKQLAEIRGVGWNLAKRNGGDILAALDAAAGKTVESHIPPKLSSEDRRRYRIQRENRETLRKWRKTCADQLGLPSERLMHRRHLEELGKALPRTREDLLNTVPLNDWQRENLEASLLETLAALPDPNQSGE